jgi:hypothetical protein
MSALKIMREILTMEITTPVYAVIAPQTASLPFIILSRIHEDQDIVLNGANPAFFTRVSVACHGASAAQAEDLAEELKTVLEVVIDRSLDDGSSPPVPWAGCTAFKEGTDVTDHDDDQTVFRRIMDWRLRWWRIAA